jgi:Zn-dependent protease
MPTTRGAIRLFRVAGINVFLHWSWFVVAYYEIQARRASYSSIAWNIAEYLALFAIVTLHEFGHSLACRSVGGQADQIVLWPLGGVAYVNPPQRPGATLWSIAAGPLVNVALSFPLVGLYAVGRTLMWAHTYPNAAALLQFVMGVNIGVLIFNTLPVYPLDGGQILRSLLWFVLGRARSLTAATVVGFFGVAGVAALLIAIEQGVTFWTVAMTAFLGYNCWNGFRQARLLAAAAKLPRHQGYACPSCHAAPPIGALWACGRCRTAFDTFETHASCPGCGLRFTSTRCFDCGGTHPIEEWASAVPTANAL